MASERAGVGPSVVGGGDCGRVSVIVPLYNHARYIADAIRSIVAQGPLVREIIVIDDGSQDSSAAVMQELSQTDPRIRFYKQTNQGAHATINRGLKEATGEFVTILNSDDAYEPGRLERLVYALDLDRGSDLAASSICFIDGAGQEIENSWHARALAGFKATGDLGLSLIDGNFLMTTSNFLMRLALLEVVGYFSPMRYAHDLDFALRVAACGRRLAFIDSTLLKYRIHDTNTIRENHTGVRLEWAIAAARFLALVWMKFGSNDWNRARTLYEILDRHRLIPAVHLCLLYFCQPAARTMSENLILDDGEFRRLLEKCV